MMTRDDDLTDHDSLRDASFHSGLVMFLESSARCQVAAGTRDAADYYEGLRLLKAMKARLKRAQLSAPAGSSRVAALDDLAGRLTSAVDVMRTVEPTYEQLAADKPLPNDTVVVEIREAVGAKRPSTYAELTMTNGRRRTAVGPLTPRAALARAEDLRVRHRLKRVMVRVDDPTAWKSVWGVLGSQSTLNQPRT